MGDGVEVMCVGFGGLCEGCVVYVDKVELFVIVVCLFEIVE